MMDWEIKVPDVKAARKQNGSGKARVLSADEARELFEGGFIRDRDRALFGICYFCGCRIGEALQLKRENVDLKLGVITFPKGITKGKVQTRQLEVVPTLLQLLEWYEDMPLKGYIFPAHAKAVKYGYLSTVQAHRILRSACDRVWLEGVSTHSFRRSYITGLWKQQMSPWKIKQFSGHKSMASLMEYLEA
ncbi:MAG: site-specific integrase [Thermosynechococcaceae cyanobacterium]